MMINDGHGIRTDTGYIAGTILTVYGDQQTGHFKSSASLWADIGDGDMQLLHHQLEVGLGDRIAAAVDKAYITAFLLEIAVQSETGGDGIRVRIIVALYGNRIKLLQF